MILPQYPAYRARRKRQAKWIRNLVHGVTLSAHDLILPLFIIEGKKTKEPIRSLPGVNRLSVDLAIEQVKKARDIGIPAVALFPVVEPSLKTARAEEAYNKNNLICRAVYQIKEKLDDIGIICDVALDPYTSHGHDGVLTVKEHSKRQDVDNDKTVEILCKQALTLAKAGCDIVAPSDMMDGRIGKIRQALDKDGFDNIMILSYACKYASSFYGPFRDAVGSAVNLGNADKKTYQMDFANNSKEAILEAAMDIAEGADIIMIKPALPYLDIINVISNKFNIPVFAYQVSGEYAALKAAANNGWLDFNKTMLESLMAIKRAGASTIFTYAALDIMLD